MLIMMMASMAIACGQSPAVPRTPTGKPEPSMEAKLAFNLRADIAEMLIVGFRGTTVDKNSTIVSDITKYGVGGVILFEYDAPTGTHHRNISSPKQLKKLCQDLQSYAQGRLLIGIDQEGGKVSRLKAADGFPLVPTAQRMAELGIDSVVYYAEVTSKMLNEAGINLNFAPCADVNVNPQCPVIGKMGRSFSSDPELVKRYCRKWMEVQSNHNIVSCMKHFPGHGSAKGDTHQGLVDVSDTWKDAELEPYRKLIAEGRVPMIMMAHVVNTHLDSLYPASLSKLCTQQLLRKSLGFKGVIVTDDMAMGAIVKQYGADEAIRLALEAGADMLCLSNNGDRYDEKLVIHTIEIIESLVRKGQVSAERIHKSAERVRAMKQKYGVVMQ